MYKIDFVTERFSDLDIIADIFGGDINSIDWKRLLRYIDKSNSVLKVNDATYLLNELVDDVYIYNFLNNFDARSAVNIIAMGLFTDAEHSTPIFNTYSSTNKCSLYTANYTTTEPITITSYSNCYQVDSAVYFINDISIKNNKNHSLDDFFINSMFDYMIQNSWYKCTISSTDMYFKDYSSLEDYLSFKVAAGDITSQDADTYKSNAEQL